MEYSNHPHRNTEHPEHRWSTGCLQQSLMEAPGPSAAVEPVPVSSTCSSRLSHPVPACGGGPGVFQAYPPGEHSSCSASTSPDESFIPSNNSTSTSDHSLSVYYQNVRGLRTKTTQLRLQLSSCDYDVLLLSETWLRPDIENAEFASEYTVFRCDRSELTSEFSRGGGVLIAVSNRFKCESVPLTNSERLEQIAVRIKLKDRFLYVVVIYLPPRSSLELYNTHARSVLQTIDLLSDNDILLTVGDYNLSELNWHFDVDINGYVPTNASTEHDFALVEDLFSAGLQQINSCVNANGRLLDLAFANLPENLDLLEPSVPLLPVDSHHPPFIVLLDVRCHTLTTPSDSGRNCNFDFRNCNFENLDNVLSTIEWDLLLGSTVDELLSNFYFKLHEVFQEHVPRKRPASNSVFTKPWWSPDLRNLRNILRKLRNRYFKSKSELDKIQLREMENTYKNLLESTYENYMSMVQANVKNNPSLFWNFVKRQRSANRIPTNVRYAGSTAVTNSDAAELFAEFFESVFTKVSPVPRADRFQDVPSYDISIPELQFSVEDVLIALKELDVNKGPGADNLPPLLLKKCASTLVYPITAIFNKSLLERKFPTAWKTAIIVPIHKSGSQNVVENYRGVSILCCLSKVFEKLIHKMMYHAASSIISEFQHGFVKNRSTTSNLMCYVTAVSRAMESHQQVDAIYVDFAKAFDTVPHMTIIDKMEHLGFPIWLTTWLFSYLTNREAYVTVNAAHSRPLEISSGVPQGSVLGPLIFIIFVNDLILKLSSLKLAFADDLKMYRIISSALDCVILQNDIDTLIVWCGDNGMRINSSKCKAISFSRSPAPRMHHYAIGAIELERVSEICDLGVTIDSKLRFNKHISIITAKAWSTLGFIRRHAADFTDIHALKTLFCALVRSILEYAAPVWSPYHLTQNIQMERVQKCFVRFALRHLPWRDPENLPCYPDRCKLIGLDILSARRVKLQQLFIFDVISGNMACPSILAEIPLYVPPRALRSVPFLAIPAHSTTYGQNNPFTSCLRVFNNVSVLFEFNMSKTVFKNRLRNLE